MTSAVAVHPDSQAGAPQTDLPARLRGEAMALMQDLEKKGVAEQDVAFTWTSGIALSFVHLAGLLDHVQQELGGIVDIQAESRAAFRKEVIDAAREQFKVIDAEILKMQLARLNLEDSLSRQINDTVKKLGQEIVAANKTANVIFQKRWNYRRNLSTAALSGGLLLFCVIGGYLWRSYQEGNALAGRYACEMAPIKVMTKAGVELACPLKDLVGTGVLASLDHRFIQAPSRPRSGGR